jgi:hypothetical protein
MRKISSFPGQAQGTALKIVLAEFPEGAFYYAPNHDLADPSMGMQIRDDENRAPSKRVAHYREMMKPYTLNRAALLMPPVVFSADGYLLDGWTRTEAARGLGWMTYPAIVLDDNYQDAPDALMEKFHTLSAMLNLTHGTGLSTAETERAILLVAKGIDLEAPGAVNELARKLQISRSWATGLLSARAANERAAGLGIDLSGATWITRTHMSDLGAWREKLPDPVFTKLLELVRDMKLSTTTQRIIAKQVFGCDTEAEKLAVIAGERASLDNGGGGHQSRPSDASRLRQALGGVTKYKLNPGQAVETIAGGSEVHIETIDNAIAVLNLIRTEQLKLNYKRELTSGSR